MAGVLGERIETVSPGWMSRSASVEASRAAIPHLSPGPLQIVMDDRGTIWMKQCRFDQ
jgi:hypothetical protein